MILYEYNDRMMVKHIDLKFPKFPWHAELFVYRKLFDAINRLHSAPYLYRNFCQLISGQDPTATPTRTSP